MSNSPELPTADSLLTEGRAYVFRKFASVIVICEWVNATQAELSVFENTEITLDAEIPGIYVAPQDCTGKWLGSLVVEPNVVMSALELAILGHRHVMEKRANKN